jgi:hypothetical protein
MGSGRSDLDLGINSALFVVKFVIIVGVHFQIVESEFFLDALLERLAFLESERVCLCDHWNDIDNIREFLQDDNVNGLEATIAVSKIESSITFMVQTHAWPDGWMKNKQQWIRVSWI